MPYIDSTQFGEVVIDGRKYSQVLIVGNSVIERDYKKLKELFNTSHKISQNRRLGGRGFTKRKS